jgi:uncharacterized protein (DUF342 family)
MFLDQQAREIEVLLSQMEHSNKEVEMLSQLVKEQSEVDIAKANEVNRLRSNLHEIQSKHEETSKKLQDAMEKLSKVSARNINKKLKHRDVTNEKLKEMTTLQQVEIEKKETDLPMTSYGFHGNCKCPTVTLCCRCICYQCTLKILW